MRTEIEDLQTGWFKIFLRLTQDEIDKLIESLKSLGPGGHFHLMSSHEEDSGVADIEVSLQGRDEQSNMFLS
jgi:hypothetical protein